MARKPSTAPRKQAKQARSKNTVAAILEATTQVLVRDGYARCTTNRVAERAGVSIASLYQYFPSKEALVAALIDEHLTEILQLQAERMLQLGDSPVAELICELAVAHVQMHRANPELHRVILEQVPGLERLKAVVEFRRRTEAQVALLLAAHREQLQIADPTMTAFVLVNMIDALKQACLLDRAEYLNDPRFLDELRGLIKRYLQRGS
jgi:AcrR family transcriptional regulator